MDGGEGLRNVEIGTVCLQKFDELGIMCGVGVHWKWWLLLWRGG
jgi:hypothetical protein